MSRKLLTDSQLDLLVSTVIEKIKAKEELKENVVVPHPKLNLAPLRKAALAYLKEREKVLSVSDDLKEKGFKISSYDVPSNIDISRFDEFNKQVNIAYTKLKTKRLSDRQINEIGNRLKAELLRETLRVDDLNKVLEAMEKKYGVA